MIYRRFYTDADGSRWMIALMPICDALGIDYNSEIDFLSSLFIKIKRLEFMMANGKLYLMLSISEKDALGWIISTPRNPGVDILRVMDIHYKIYESLNQELCS